MESQQAVLTDDMKEYCKQLVQINALYTLVGEKTPKDMNAYLFIGRNGGEFTGNVKYLFLYFIEHLPEVKACFLTYHKKVYQQLTLAGLPVIMCPSAEEEKMATFGTVIVDSISFRRKLNYPLIDHARQIQLWHGVGNKKIGFQLQGVSCLEGRDQTLVKDHSGYDVIVSTSPFYTDEVFKTSMEAKEFVSLGYPRTDIFFNKLGKHSLLGSDAGLYSRVKRASEKGPVILYTPTFRDNGVNPITQDVLKVDEFVAFMKKMDAHLVIKTHTRTPIRFDALTDNLTICDASSDIYPLMPLADMMITDYSSIFTDYLLLDRPVLFFWSDYEQYMEKDRGFQFPLATMCPGPKCRSAGELYHEITEALQGKDAWADARRAMRDKSFSHINGGACERIAEYILKTAPHKESDV